MDWLSVTVGLLAGWFTAFALHVAIGRGYLEERRRAQMELGLDPLWQLSRKKGKITVTVTTDDDKEEL